MIYDVWLLLNRKVVCKVALMNDAPAVFTGQMRGL